MIEAQLIAEATFPHRLRVAVAARGSRVVVGSPDGDAAVLDESLARIGRLHLPRDAAFELSPDGERLAVFAGRELLVQTLRGEVLARAAVAVPDCAFSSDGRLLCTTHASGLVELRDAATLHIVAAAEVEDPFGDSAFVPFAHPEPSTFVLWIAAGQDGQSLASLRYGSDRLIVDDLTDLTETTPPAFDASGDTFLVSSGGNRILRFAFPSGELLASGTWDADDDDALAEQIRVTSEDDSSTRALEH